jgi:tRNA (adenine22-N1)-methyltransferase
MNMQGCDGGVAPFSCALKGEGGILMTLDDRLQALADFVEPGSRVADVGTDHGYLAIELVKSGKADFVIASDKNSGPLEAAGRSLKMESSTAL